VIEKLFVNREPVTPVWTVSPLSFHEAIESSQSFRILAKPGKTVYLYIVRVLKRGEHGIIWVAIVGGLEIFGNFLDRGQELMEAVYISMLSFWCFHDFGEAYSDSTTPIDVRCVISLHSSVGRYSLGAGSSTKPLATRTRIMRSGRS
jgi:hypothetical protein